MIVDVFRRVSARGAGVGAQSSKGGRKGFQNPRTNREIVELALSRDMNETGGFKLFDVVRQRCRRNGKGCVGL